MRYYRHPEAGHLGKLGRVAIWNRKKIVVLIAIAVWVADVAFLINGEYRLPIIEVFPTSPWYYRCRTGEFFHD